MPRISTEPLDRFHIRLFRRDVKALRAWFPSNTTDAMRNIIHAYVVAQEQRSRPSIDALDSLELTPDELKALGLERETLE